jgi:signal transduction histidine kinase
MQSSIPWYTRTSTTLATATFFALLGWVLYTTCIAFFYPTTPYPELFLTNISLPESILRLLVSSCFFLFAILLLHSITRQKQYEQNLQKANEHLHQTITTLHQQVAEKTQEIDSLLRQKNDLIIGLSHDLKTPLTPLMGLLPMIIKDEHDPRLKELLIISLRNVHYIRDLVSRAIDLSLLDSSALGLHIEPTNLCIEVDAIVENKAHLFDIHHVLVDNTINEHLNALVDKNKLREVLNNLVMNAITYSSPDGGSIRFSAKRKQHEIMVSITDTGIGMTPEQLDHLFDELYKGDDARTNHKKTGLSLSICKRIVEKHGGKIGAESPGPGKGTTVWFTIPAVKNEKQQLRLTS